MSMKYWQQKVPLGYQRMNPLQKKEDYIFQRIAYSKAGIDFNPQISYCGAEFGSFNPG
jgi:hypothetical protein